MATNLTVNNTTFPYPDTGDEPGWGDGASGWAAEVTQVLEQVQGTNDIPESTFNIANNTTSKADIVGFVFNPSAVRSAVVDYSVYRTTNTTELAEKGTLELIYKNGGTVGAKWSIGRVIFGDDAGIEITMTDAGQAQYTSSNMSGTSYTGTIVFEGTAILQ